MKSIHKRFSLFIILFVITGFLPVEAMAGYKITANIVDMDQVCFITGQVKDATGSPVHPAEVTFKCGDTSTKVSTLPGGFYINNPPTCVTDFEITATAQGQKSTSLFRSVGENEMLPLDLSFPPSASLEDAILTLQILCKMDTDEMPLDHNQDNLIDIEDAIMNIQYLAGLREDGGTSGQSVGRVALSSSYKNVQLWSDTNGDGVEEQILDVTTDAYGYIEIDGLSEGDYTLIANSSGNDNAVRLENIKIAGQNVDLKTVQLKPVGSISGTVQLEGQSDHTGIHVYVPGTSYTANTDSQGSFTISNVPEGTYDIRAEKTNFGTVIANNIPVASGQDNSIDEPFIMPSVVGQVNGSATLNGMTDHAGILVTLRKNTGITFITTTDTAGAYAFEDIPTGQYTLEAGKQGYILEQSTLNIQSGANQPDNIILDSNNNTGTFSGTITLDNISDYSGILVSIAGTGYLAITDESGSFIINNIPEGTYTVFLNSEGYRAKKVEGVEIQADNTTSLNESLIASSSLQDVEKKNGSIVGTVKYLDKTNHAGIGIKVEGTTLLNSSDSNGAFIIENVPAGTYTVTFTESNHKTITMTGIVISPWSTVFIEDVVMIPLFGKITGTVNLEGESNYSGVLISVDSTSVTAVSSQDGSFILYPLLEGNNYTLRFSKQDFENEILTDKTVVAGQTTDLTNPVVLKKRPDPPTGISAAYLTNTSVKITWQASGSTDVTGYDVYYGIAQDQINTKATSSPVTSQTGGEWTFTVTGLTEGTYYWFAVKAIDADGLESDLSASAQPDPMGEITGTVHLEGESDHSGASVSVDGTSVTAVTDPAGAFILSPLTAGAYTLRFSKAGFVEKTLGDVSVTAGQTLNITDTVSIQKATGDISGQAYLEGSTFDQHGDITVSLVGTTISTLTNAYGAFTLTLVPAGNYTVRAIKENFIADEITDFQVVSGQTNDLSRPLVLKKPPEPPTGITANQASGSSVDASWTESTSNDVAGYNVYYGTSSDHIDQKANTDPVSGTSFEVTGLEKGTTYYFGAKAIDNDGLTSVLSQYVSTEIVPQVPTFPEYTEILEGQYPFINPKTICLSRNEQHGYVTNPSNNVVSLIDLNTKEVLGTIVVGSYPNDLVFNPVKDEVYCVNKYSNNVTVIDTMQNNPDDAVIATLSTGLAPNRCLVSADGKYLFVSCTDATAESVTVIDLDTRSEITESPIPVGTDPQGMAIAGNRLYVANESDNTVSVIDIDINSQTKWQVIGSPIPVGGSPVDVSASIDGSYVYVANSGSDTVSVINTTTYQVSPLDVGDYPIHMAVSGSMLYVSNYMSDNFSMINTDTNQVLNTTVGVGQYPVGIAVTANGETIFVVNNLSESVSILEY